MNLSQRIIIPLILLQIISVAYLWSLDALNAASQGIFTLFLAADLLSFAAVAHIYRSSKARAIPGKYWLVAVCCMILLLLLASLFVS